MSEGPGSRAAELAAAQVESIVAAAQEAADKLRREAERELQNAERKAAAATDEVREEARELARKELENARRKAVTMGEDARREAASTVEAAESRSREITDRTDRAVAGRVAAAEKAAADVLEEARALSNGLRQLGSTLGAQAERILRDVEAAHRRMQADLRVESGGGLDLDDPLPRRSPTVSRRPPDVEPQRDDERTGRRFEPVSRREGANPFDELEVPSWVARDS